MIVLNELKKLLKVKAVWMIYLLLIAFMTLKIVNGGGFDFINTFTNEFVNHHRSGPYDIQLIHDYQNLLEDYQKCEIEQEFGEVDCDEIISPRSRELKSLYPNISYKDLHWALVYSFGGSYSYDDTTLYDLDHLNKQIEEEKLIHKNFIETFFFNKLINDHQSNPRINEVKEGKVYFSFIYRDYNLKEGLIFGGVISVIMIIFAICQTQANDINSNMEQIILSSKLGRKMIVYKLFSSILFSIIVGLLCFLPLITIDVVQSKWYLFLESKLFDSTMPFIWFDFSLLHFILFSITISIFSIILISIITLMISIYSRRLVNMISYHLTFITLIIGYLVFFSDVKIVLLQLIKIVLNHTPYGLIYNNINMFQYSISHYDYYFTYKEFPIVFVFVNSLIISLLFYITKSYYKKMSL